MSRSFVVLIFFLIVSSLALGQQVTLTVTNTSDGGLGSLRQAILDSNNFPGTNVVNFNISGTGIQAIQLQSDLPVLTSPTVFEGATQGQFQSGSSVEIQGQSMTLGSGSDGCAVYGLTFNGCQLNVASNSNTIQGCNFGVHADLSAASFFNGTAVKVTGNSNSIGGNGSGKGCLISNCTTGIALSGTGNLVEGNLVGTNAAGTLALSNTTGISITGIQNTVGGDLAGDGNVISGNTGDGVLIGSNLQNVQVQGNLVGTNAAGSSALGNGGWGVELQTGSHDNTIGGYVAGTLVVCGNGSGGIKIDDDTGSSLLSNVIQDASIGVSGTTAIANTGPGIYLGIAPAPSAGTDALGTQVNDCTIENNTGNGVTVAGPGNSFLSDIIENNTGNGVLLLDQQTNGSSAAGTTISQTAMLGNASPQISIASSIVAPSPPTVTSAVSNGTSTTIWVSYAGGISNGGTDTGDQFMTEVFETHNFGPGQIGSSYLADDLAASGSYEFVSNTPQVGSQIVATTTAINSIFQNNTAFSGATSPFSAPVTVVPDMLKVTAAATTLFGGQSTTGTVTLWTATPVNATVDLSSSNTALVQVPASMTVSNGSASGTFPITTTGITSSTSAQVIANVAGSPNSFTVTITLKPVLPKSIALYNPKAPVGSQKVTMLVILNGPAPPGGLLLFVNASSQLNPPSQITVPQNARYLYFTFGSNAVGADSPVTVTVTALDGSHYSTNFTLHEASPARELLPSPTVIGGANTVAYVYLNGAAGSGGDVVDTSSGNTAAAITVTPCTVPAGKTGGSFVIHTLGVAASCTASINATIGSTTATATLTVNPAALTGLTANATSISGGRNVYITVQLNGAAPPAGATVSMQTNNAALTPPATVQIPAGSHSALIRLTAGHVTGTAPVTLTGSYSGVNHSVVVNVSG